MATGTGLLADIISIQPRCNFNARGNFPNSRPTHDRAEHIVWLHVSLPVACCVLYE